MRKAAEAGRGSFVFISAQGEVREKMGRLFAKLEQPQVTGIDVQWPGGVVVDSYPSKVADLYLGEPVTLKGRASETLRDGDVVLISGESATGGWSAELPLAAAAPGKGIAALWARARIGSLMDDERRTRAPAVRAAIIETALRHHLVSKYTSLVAVDKTPARPLGDPLSSEQLANLMPYGQSRSAIFGFPQTATAAPLLRIAGMSWLTMALLLFVALRVGARWRRGRRG